MGSKVYMRKARSDVCLAMLRGWILGEAWKPDLVKWSEADGDQILSSTIDHFYFQTNVPPRMLVRGQVQQ